MIRKKEEFISMHYEHMRDGKLYVDAVKFLEAEDAYGAGSFFGHATVPPGGSIGIHRHTGEFEVYYILSGSAKVWDNDEEHILTAGDMMQCRDGDTHGIENVGVDSLEFIAMVIKTRN